MVADWLATRRRIAAFRYKLLAWYGAHRRDLAWRHSRDPYHIWISEIMLQQTRVKQVGEYFARFLRAFPTVQALAGAGEDQVLKVWEGLGYYARARNVHKAAKEIVALGGLLPDTYEGLLALPGIGPYTAAAVSSIAFDRDHPVLDGNVERVLCRLLRFEEDPRRGAAKTALIGAAERLLAPGRAGDFNQAMMELGARVCTPAKPHCGECPVREGCRALRELEDPALLPRKTPRKPRPHYQVAAGLIWKRGRLLIAQRPSEGLLGGLWEFPGGKQEEWETLAECLAREIREELAVEIEVGECLARVEHGFTHFSITLHAFGARWKSGEPQAIGCAAWRWAAPAELAQYAFSRADRRIIEELGLGDLEYSPGRSNNGERA
ncbi:MAG: A/G-specific adenine glycosylase [Candidatus Handelsmanbacteria bacterium]|nr:A/G-specific adenine glycosylase [Candidatus Handelsmanbacteria bacterium]